MYGAVRWWIASCPLPPLPRPLLQFTVQVDDMIGDPLLDRIRRCLLQPYFLAGPHLDHLSSPLQQGIKRHRLRIGNRTGLQLHCLGEAGNQFGVDGIRLGQAAGGLGKVKGPGAD